MPAWRRSARRAGHRCTLYVAGGCAPRCRARLRHVSLHRMPHASTRRRHGCTRNASMHPRRLCRDGWRSEQLPPRQRWPRGRRALRPSRRSSPMPTPSTSRRRTSEGIGSLPSAMACAHYWSPTKRQRRQRRPSTCMWVMRAIHRIDRALPTSANTCSFSGTSSTLARAPSPNTCRGEFAARISSFFC